MRCGGGGGVVKEEGKNVGREVKYRRVERRGWRRKVEWMRV